MRSTFSLVFKKVLYTHDLASIPSKGEAGFPAPTNPLAMVFSVWRTTLLPSHWDTYFSLLGMGIPTSSCPRELDLSDAWEKSPFTYFLSCPSWISLTISFFSWYQSLAWCLLTLYNLYHLFGSGPITFSFGEDNVGMFCR